MKKLICNIGSIVLGFFASAMLFVPMFDVKYTSGSSSMFADHAFHIFKSPYVGSEGYNDIFRIIAMYIALITIAAFILLAITTIIGFFVKNNSTIAIVKKVLALVLIFTAILFVFASIVFMLQNVVESSMMKLNITVSNWFAFLSVAIGFIVSSILSMCAKN